MRLNATPSKITRLLHFFPEPSIDFFPECVTASLGEYIVIQVLVSGTPQPSLSWTHDGMGVERDATIEQANDGTLVMPSAENCHEGIYCLAASNGHGEATAQLVLTLEGERDEEEPGVRLSLSESTPVPLDSFGDYVTRNHDNSNEGFQIQFMVGVHVCMCVFVCHLLYEVL